MFKDLLLIIDMQEAYNIGGLWECGNISEVKKNIKSLIEIFGLQDIVFTRFIASDNPIGTWKNYNDKYNNVNKSDFSNKLISDFSDNDYKVIDKSTYSCYKNAEIKTILNSYDRVAICGVIADCCVLATILDIIDTGKPIIYILDTIGEYDKGSLKVVNTIMGNMNLHVTSLSCKEYVKSKSREKS